MPPLRCRVLRGPVQLTTALLMAAAVAAAHAQTVSMSGRLGDKALLMIDGSPRTLAVGTSAQGVKLVSVNAEGAVVEIGGKRATLPLGGTQVNLGGAGGEVASGSRIVIAAGSGGHFITGGSINGRAVQFMVDTGATSIAISQAEADRIGLKYKDAPRGTASTANGQVAFHVVSLDAVRIGDVQVYNVQAVVIPAQMPHILLGNSFLSRFQMRRDNDVLTLDRKP